MKTTPHLKGKEHLVILAVFGLLLIVLGCANHFFFRTYTHDYGTYSHQLWDQAHFVHNPSFVANHCTGAYFLQLHLYLLFYALTPFYWLLSWLAGTYTLIVVQGLFVVFGGYGVYLLVREYSGKHGLALISLLVFFLFLGRWTAITSDFNDYTYGTCLIPWFFLYNYRKQWIAAFVFMFLLWLNKENMAILTFFFSLFFLITHWPSKPGMRANILFMGLSIAWFVFSFTVLVPWVNERPGAQQYVGFQYHALGETPLEALQTILARPFYVLSLFFVNHGPGNAPKLIKLETYLVFFLSGGFLLFLRPRYLLLFLPVFAQKMLHSNYYNWSISGFYIADIAVLLPLSVGMVLSDLKHGASRRKTLAWTVVLLATGVTVWKMHSKRAIAWTTNAKECVYCAKTYRAPFDAGRVHAQLDKVPAGAKVSASTAVLPHLSFRKDIYLFPTVKDAQYIVILKTDTYPMTKEQMEAEIDTYLEKPSWALIVDEKPLLIFKQEKA
jgi:uncharacterized membrane protein